MILGFTGSSFYWLSGKYTYCLAKNIQRKVDNHWVGVFGERRLLCRRGRHDMRDCAHGTNILAYHARNIAGRLHGNRIKGADKACIVWTYSHAGAAIDAGIPADQKHNRFFPFHK
jgi:hypothetical protein